MSTSQKRVVKKKTVQKKAVQKKSVKKKAVKKKVAKKKLTQLQKVKKALKAAANMLNKKILQPDFSGLKNTKGFKSATVTESLKIVLYQVWCESQNKVVTTASTDKNEQQRLSDEHDETFGHTSKVIASS